jgi:hypothetical protein
MRDLSHGEGNPSRGENPTQILVLQVGGSSWGQLPHTVKNHLAKEAQRGRVRNDGWTILGRRRHVKGIRKELFDTGTWNVNTMLVEKTNWKA